MFCPRMPIYFTRMAVNQSIPQELEVLGMCPHVTKDQQHSMSTMRLRWDDKKESLEFDFLLNLVTTGGSEMGAKHSWYLNNITYYQHTGAAFTLLAFLDDVIVSSDVYSFRCGSIFRANLTHGSDYVIFSMQNYTVQAFRLNETNFRFANPDFCYNSGLPFFIPLVTGVILLVLLLVPIGVGVVSRVLVRKKDDTTRYSRLKSDA